MSRLSLATKLIHLFLPLACASAGGLPQPTAQHLDLARATEPQVTLEDLSRGRTLYGARCGSCHALRDPSVAPKKGWQHEIDDMREHHGVQLTSAESRDIRRYLDAMSAAGPRQ